MIKNADRTLLPQLNKLWNACFGDEIEYSSFFFSHKMIGDEVFENQFVYMQDQKAVSMLSVLYATIRTDNGVMPFWYIYGVATQPEYQKRGFAGELIRHVLSRAIEKNAAVGLVPASEGLFGYYKRFGFETFFYKCKQCFTVECNAEVDTELMKNVKIESVSPAKYNVLRNETFHVAGCVQWDDKAVEYALMENRNLGGMAYRISFEKQEYVILFYAYKGELVVRETNLPVKILKEVCVELAKKYNCTTVKIITAPMGQGELETLKHGMIYNYQGLTQNAYLGLALD